MIMIILIIINFHDYLDDNDHHHRHDKNEQVSSFYTQQLNALMTTLHATEPHFIRHYMKINEDDDADEVEFIIEANRNSRFDI